MTDEDPPTLDRALDLIRAGLREGTAALAAIGNPKEAFDQATVYAATAQREVRMTTAHDRARQARRIWEDEETGERSLAWLAGKTNVKTKERARQWLKATEEEPA